MIYCTTLMILLLQLVCSHHGILINHSPAIVNVHGTFNVFGNKLHASNVIAGNLQFGLISHIMQKAVQMFTCLGRKAHASIGVDKFDSMVIGHGPTCMWPPH